MSNWFTADTHFGSDSKEIMIRDNRPFKDINEYTEEQIRIWNEQASSDDTIYVIGEMRISSSLSETMSSVQLTTFLTGLLISSGNTA